ncbi:RING finger and transmembrane domain-containing protein [Actinidia chinensis var. chinensis]|uniref:RING finger and transmembrane domain-containing protein n=1 Tax=Actinidia chinensis var. chinensis TaxID=1590841 RepID=A0A2R6RR10_ACTCC|nr:RING finger and transmembrane domain-containing protein [Actinidia chinensis var. chinensis]
METSTVSDPDTYTNSSSTSNNSSNSRRNGFQFSTLSFLRAPVSTLLEYSGVLRPRRDHHEAENLIVDGGDEQFHRRSSDFGSESGSGEVSIRIIGAGEQENVGFEESEEAIGQISGGAGPRLGDEGGDGGEVGGGERASSGTSPSATDVGNGDGGGGNGGRDSSYQRYDIQQVARWVEQVLPFSLLLLVVFIRQHLQGFFVTIWITAVMFKSNDILRKQTALKGERKISVLVGISTVFMLQVIGVYWWYHNDDLLYPLFLIPPKAVPPFWHAIFIILVNDTLVRQAAMALKCMLLMYYKNGRGNNFRRQGQILTLIEYTLLLYRALLPTPVWYRFFLNKEYGGLFSSLTTGLYLTFKLTSVVEKVQSFFASLKALSQKDIHYGSYATLEQVNAAGDLCAICQEKMHAPILLRCKHIFCEDCVSEWFERERTCPLCRALVKAADLRSFGDGSTSLFFQLF